MLSGTKLTNFLFTNSLRKCLQNSQRYTFKPPKSLYPTLEKGYEEEHPLAHQSWHELLEDMKEDGPPEVNIGINFAKQELDKSIHRKQAQLNRHNKELEQQARLGKLQIPLDEVQRDYRTEDGPDHAVRIAKHYNIFKDLFNEAHFTPVADFSVGYIHDDEYLNQVYLGNQILPSEAARQPLVSWDTTPGSLWTLIMTNPDSNLKDSSKEYLHWFVGNIPDCDIEEGQTYCDYLQPFPAKGTGFHRHVFILFKQSQTIVFTDEKRPDKCNSLENRTFSTCEFFRQHSEVLTPMGLAFFQAEYDVSVQEVFHHVLNMREPSFEYQHPVSYRRPLKKFPHKEPFNRYFDRYRDRKEIAEQILKMKLKMISPYQKNPEREKYPLIHRARQYRPSWLKQQDELMHKRLEQFKDLP